MPDTWISLFFTRSAGHTAQDEIMSPKYNWDSLWIDMILEELRDTCVETGVEKADPAVFMKRCTGLYGKWIKYTFFRSKMEQNIEFLVPGWLGKISKISQQHFAAKYRGERSRICLGLLTTPQGDPCDQF